MIIMEVEDSKINYFNIIRSCLASFLLGYIIGKDMLPPIF